MKPRADTDGTGHTEDDPGDTRRMRLLDDDQPETDAHRARMRAKIAAGLDSARQGRLVDGDEVFERLLKKVRSVGA
jgi:hypothetical protein